MLYWLYETFHINLLHYITVRATIGFFVGFLLTIFILPYFIAWAKAKKTSQPIFELAPKTHQAKAGTPTMGGIVFMGAAALATLACAQISNIYILLALSIIILFSLIGAGDDIGKIIKKDNQAGMKPKSKLKWQILASLGVAFVIFLIPGTTEEFFVPFYKYPLFDMGVYAIILWTLVIVASSNAVNITDGLDGLATVPSIYAFISLSGLAYVAGNAMLSAYLFWPKTAGVGELAVVGASLIGALIGFLWYNSNPAEVFMGDSGSLPLGALMGYFAVVTKSEILLLFIGFIFVLETVSVIIQVTSYKTRGKRVFLMAPLHHHFEMKKWAENKIIVRFWIVALLSNILAILTIKLR